MLQSYRYSRTNMDRLISVLLFALLALPVLTVLSTRRECSNGTFETNCAQKCGHCKNDTSCDIASGICEHGCEPGWKDLHCIIKCDEGQYGTRCLEQCGMCLHKGACNPHNGECVSCHPGFYGKLCKEDANLLNHIKHLVTVTASSVYKTWDSIKAIDGTLAANPETCNCCAGTENAETSWLRIDLHRKYPIRKIILYGRTNEHTFQQLEGSHIILQNDSIDNGYNSNSSVVSEEDTYVLTLPDILCKYVTVKRAGKLTLCEIRIEEGECVIGTFGNECEKNCFCADKKPCDRQTGVCMSSICEIGFMGESCNEECPFQTFGQECSKRCYCFDDEECTKDYGLCPGECAPGYQGHHCEMECPSGRFGFRCDHTCGHCRYGKTCNHVNGLCEDGCKDGYDGMLCNHALNLLERIKLDLVATMSSTYLDWGPYKAIDGNDGPDPILCECCSATNNEAFSWWKVNMERKFSISSIEIIPRKDERVFHHLTGFTITLKNDSAENGVLIYTNEEIDGSNSVKISIPNILASILEIRRSGILVICEVKVFEGVCQVGYYGEECDMLCNCADKLSCNRTDGTCQTPVCDIGWSGPACNLACPVGFYGQDCKNKCGECADLTHCHSKTGICQKGCKYGFVEPFCKYHSETKSGSGSGHPRNMLAFLSCTLILLTI
ncbi:multiple epidermal growth factor-like domains protein 10 isoform X2 [Mercenaria mercenaria]|uniref:multiple epidermal growth factor-like domains protein 10 isoform X2 n=1 Tax=Mercenaria mercenaria TaxID=6596 RepID=UPI00234F7F57|nr:multiple epidermal growth factor-like domains protein 10 isoform X2 [Mercenaria mercenaria]